MWIFWKKIKIYKDFRHRHINTVQSTTSHKTISSTWCVCLCVTEERGAPDAESVPDVRQGWRRIRLSQHQLQRERRELPLMLKNIFIVGSYGWKKVYLVKCHVSVSVYACEFYHHIVLVVSFLSSNLLYLLYVKRILAMCCYFAWISFPIFPIVPIT